MILSRVGVCRPAPTLKPNKETRLIMGNLNFDATGIEPDNGPVMVRTPVPAGWYDMTIDVADYKKGTKPAAGTMVILQFKMDENSHPEFARRLAFAYLCIHHQSEQTRNIAKGKMSKLAQILGKEQIGDTEDLVGMKLRVKLGIKKPTPEYPEPDSNNVEGFQAREAGEKQEAPGASPPAASQPASTDNKPTGGVQNRAWS